MHAGFTGTQKGLTPPQRDALEVELLRFSVLHHGDCIGADAQAHRIAKGLGIWTVSHPPTDDRKRAFCDADEERAPLPHLERNRQIVDEGEVLISCPRLEEKRQPRSGTWEIYWVRPNQLAAVVIKTMRAIANRHIEGAGK